MKRVCRLRVALALLAGLAVGAVTYAVPLDRPRAVLAVGPILINPEERRLYFSPDSRWLVTLADVAHDDGSSMTETREAVLWDAATGTKQALLDDEDPSVRSVTFSPDGQYGAALKWRERVMVWRLPTGRLCAEYQLPREEARFAELIYTPAGQLLARERHPGGGIWDVASASFLLRLPPLGVEVDRDNAWDAHGLRVGWEEKRVRVHKLGTDDIWDIPLPPEGELTGGYFSGDGRVMWGWTLQPRRVMAYDRDAAVWRHLPYAEHGGGGLSHDGRWAVCVFLPPDEAPRWWSWLEPVLGHWQARERWYIEAYEVSTGRRNLHVQGAQNFFFAPDGKTLATVTPAGDVQLWDFPAQTPWLTIAGSGLVAAALCHIAQSLASRGAPRASTKAPCA